MKVHVDPKSGEAACEHGVALDVHCCGCHSGFVFDINHVCGEDEEEEEDESAQPDSQNEG